MIRPATPRRRPFCLWGSMAIRPPPFRRKVRAATPKWPVGIGAVEATLLRGVQLQQARDFIGAERCYQTVLRDHPDHPDALNLLSTLAVEAGRLGIAEQLLRGALAQSPKHPGYLSNLGNVLALQRRHPEAAQAFEAALASQPGLIDAMTGLSTAYLLLNRGDAALAMARRAYCRDPETSKAALALASVLVGLGETEEATVVLRKLIATGQQVPAALIALATAHKFTDDDPEPALMERLANDRRLPDGQRSALLHALGKARADLREYDAAFAAFNTAKQLAGRDFNLDQNEAYYDALIANLTPDFFAARQGFGHSGVTPVFVVGMPRSGTTLAEQICSSHSEVRGIGEVPSLSHIAHRINWRRATPQELVSALSAITAEQSRELARAYLDDIAHYGGTGRLIINKMPHNYEYLGLIALLFPDARIIHCTRDPLDNCISCFTHNFSESHGYNSDLATMGRYYRSYQRLMAHWQSAAPIAILDNPYEAMVADQEGQSRRLVDFLGLEWEQSVLNFQDNDRLVLTPSRWQVRQPIYRSSVQQWKRYDAHIGPLKEALGIADAARA